MTTKKSVRKEVAKLAGEKLTREAQIENIRAEEEAREITLAFSSEEPVERWFGLEILRHDNGAPDFSRLESGVAGVLFAHGRDGNFGLMPVGRVIKAWVDPADNKGRATIQFDTDEKSELVWSKVQSGTLQGVSFGYTWGSHSYEYVEAGDISSDGRFGPYDQDAAIVRKWSVLEISLEPIPADATVGVGRSIEEEPEAPEEAGNDERSVVTVDEKETQVIKEPEVNLDEVRAAAVKAEQERNAEIVAIGLKHSVESERVQKWISEGVSVDAARKEILESMISEREAVSSPAVVVEDERDKVRAAMEAGIQARVSFLPLTDEQRKTGYEEFAGMTMREIARDVLRRNGIKVPMHPMEMVGRAMATDDFPYVLGNIAHKSVLAGWEGAQETWPIVFNSGSVSNFHIHTAARTSELEDLDLIPEHGEYKYGEAAEQFEQYQVVTYGKLFALTRQAIVNDDIGQIAELPMKRGEAAARKVGDVAWAQITANPNMGDGRALFHNTYHYNLQAAGAVPGVATIGAAVTAMKSQKDIKGKRRLNVRPEFFVAPVALEVLAETFFNTVLIGGETNQPNLKNIYSGAFTRVYEPRLDDADTDAWYLFAGKGKTVTVYFLNGVQAPYLETKQGWSMDGVEYKVRIDAGAKAMDWRGLYKNAGTGAA